MRHACHGLENDKYYREGGTTRNVKVAEEVDAMTGALVHWYVDRQVRSVPVAQPAEGVEEAVK